MIIRYPETGYVGDASDAAREPKPLPTRMHVVDNDPVRTSGGVAIAAGLRDTRVDYISALPVSVL